MIDAASLQDIIYKYIDGEQNLQVLPEPDLNDAVLRLSSTWRLKSESFFGHFRTMRRTRSDKIWIFE